MKGWSGHLDNGWTMQGKMVESTPGTRTEDFYECSIRSVGGVGGISFLLNTTFAALERTIIERQSPNELIVLSLGDPPVVDETGQAVVYMAKGKAIGPDELPAELLSLWLSDISHETLLAFQGIIVAVWMTREVPQE